MNKAGLFDTIPGSVYVADLQAAGRITTQNLIATGLVPTPNSAIGYTSMDGVGDITFQVFGTYTGALTPQVTLDGTNWVDMGPSSLLNIGTGVYSQTVASATQGIFQVDVSGFMAFRLAAKAAVTGAANITMRASQSTGMIALDNAIPAGTNSIGTVILGAGSAAVGTVSLTAPTPHTLTAAATTNATSVKTAAGTLYGLTIDNVSALTRYLKLYNKASAPTVGTDVPVLTIPLAATSAQEINFGTLGMRFTTGIAYAITGAIAVTDTTVIAAGDCHLTMNYV